MQTGFWPTSTSLILQFAALIIREPSLLSQLIQRPLLHVIPFFLYLSFRHLFILVNGEYSLIYLLHLAGSCLFALVSLFFLLTYTHRLTSPSFVRSFLLSVVILQRLPTTSSSRFRWRLFTFYSAFSTWKPANQLYSSNRYCLSILKRWLHAWKRLGITESRQRHYYLFLLHLLFGKYPSYRVFL
jgi:hypothetical protein